MQYRSTFKKRLLSQVISTSLLAGAATSAMAGDFVLSDNKINWANGAVSGSATVNAGGTADDIYLVHTSNANTLPNVSFTLEDLASTSDTYYVGLFMQVNSDSAINQVEMSLGTVQVTTVNGAVTGAAMVTSGGANYRPIKVNAQRSTGGSTINLSADFNAQANMISFASNTVTVQVDNVISALSGNNNLFDDIIARFASNGEYSYSIGIQHLASTTGSAEIGTNDGSNTFVKSPLAAPAITLGTPTLAALFPSATYLSGNFNIVDSLPSSGGDSGSGGGGGGSTGSGEVVVDDSTLDSIDEDNAEVNDAVNDAIENGGDVPQEVVNQTEDALDQSSTAVNNLVEVVNDGGTLDPNNALEATRRIAETLDIATNVVNNSTSDTADVEEKTLTALTNLVTVVSSLQQSNTELNDAQKEALNAVVQKAGSAIGGLVRRSQTEDDVDDKNAKLAALGEAMANSNTEPTQEATEEFVDAARAILKRRLEVQNGGGSMNDEEQVEKFNENPASNAAKAPPVPPAPPRPSTITQDTIVDSYGGVGSGPGAFPVVTGALSSSSQNAPAGTPASGTAVTSSFYGSNISGGQAGSGAPGILNGAGRAGSTNLPATGLGGGIGGGFGGGFASSGLGSGITTLKRNSNITEPNISSILSPEGRSRQLAAATATETTETENQVEYDELTGLFTITLGTEKYLATLRSTKPVPVKAQTRFELMPDGNITFINAGYAYILSPGSASLLGFLESMLEQDFTPTVRADGSFYLQLSETDRFSGSYAFENMMGKDTASCTTVSFEAPTTHVNQADYAFTMRCDDVDVSQKIYPYVDATQFLNSLADFELDASYNRQNGFVTVEGIGNLKPSFFVREATAAETEFHTANKDRFGLAFMGEDVNGDGKLDYKVISATGVQVLYAAP